MSTRTIPELITLIERTQTLRANHEPNSEQWQSASKQIADLLEEMRRRTSGAVGAAFCATLMGLSQRDLDDEIKTGDRLLTELRKRGLAVFPRRFILPE